MPGNWDGKSRPSNSKYRENYDDIFKNKRIRVLGSQAIKHSGKQAKPIQEQKRQRNKKDSKTING